MSLIAPPALRPGAHLRVIAPSSPFEREAFDRGVLRLRERYEVSFDEGLFARDAYLAGTDDRRLRELLDAIRDPDVSAIACARGGYGATRLLDALDPREVSARPKLLVGFSDVTALHALWARAGVRSLHASMIASLGKAEERLVVRWIAAVEGAACPSLTGLRSIAGGRARGPLLGGNLSVLHALCGTPYAPPLGGAILFLEDVGEAPYRIDRMLTSLRQAGWLERVSGVVLGAFSECRARGDGRRVEDVLADRLSDLGVPVVSGVPAGHVDDNLELPLGAEVELDGDAGSIAPCAP